MSIPFPPHLLPLIQLYLLPPTPPIPSHLISNALLQRHYFLNIDPSADPGSYFLWPSDNATRIAQILEDLAAIEHSNDSQDASAPQVTYEVERGTLVARVGLRDRLQIVFHLDRRPPSSEDARTPASRSQDEQPEWRYHNVILASDAGKGYDSPEAAVSAASQSTGEVGDDSAASIPKAADYWDGWHPSPDATPGQEKVPLPPAPSSLEDSYYSRYSDVLPVVGDSEPGSHRTSVSYGFDLPQIPTEGFNTPDRVSEANERVITPSLLRSRFGEVPPNPSPGLRPAGEVSASRVITGEEALAASDQAVIDIIRAAYQLWNSSSADAVKQKLSFHRLVDHALQFPSNQ